MDVQTVKSTPEAEQERAQRAQRARTRLMPAVGLFFLAPLVGEFLLGNLPITWLWALPFLAPLYGGGALLIREITRRLKLGWPGLVVLALAYAVIEEAFVTQSLFNPDYVGLRLLDYGYLPALGISAWWTVFVLGIHTIWSIAVPIALVEGLTPAARCTPWLGPLGLVVSAVLFVTGCVLTFQEQGSFMASSVQHAASAGIVLALIAAAFLIRRIGRAAPVSSQAAPGALRVGVTAFGLGSLFMALAIIHNAIPAFLNGFGMLALILTGCALLWNWSRRADWGEAHRLAAAGGLLLTYAWYGFVQVPSIGDTSPLIDAVGNAIFAGGALLLLAAARRRVQQPETR